MTAKNQWKVGSTFTMTSNLSFVEAGKTYNWKYSTTGMVTSIEGTQATYELVHAEVVDGEVVDGEVAPSCGEGFSLKGGGFNIAVAHFIGFKLINA